MGIRTILYGYEMCDGRKAIRESEAETVRLIFRMYLAGFSYHKITEALNKRSIPYGDTESPWNKARIKRILEDRRYAGENGYVSGQIKCTKNGHLQCTSISKKLIIQALLH